MRKTIVTLTVFLGLFGTAACTSTGPTPNVTVAETTPPADESTEPTVDDSTGEPAGIDQLELTEIATEMTWDQASEKSKNDMCAGVAMFGTDWAADQLRTGASDDTTLDWDHAASLIKAKCARR